MHKINYYQIIYHKKRYKNLNLQQLKLNQHNNYYQIEAYNNNKLLNNSYNSKNIKMDKNNFVQQTLNFKIIHFLCKVK